MRSGNPVLQDKAFQGLFAEGEQMTINGTINKTGMMLLLLVITAGWTWLRFSGAAAEGGPAAAMAASGTVTIRSAPRRMIPSAFASGWRTAMPSALVSARLPATT